MAIDLEELKAAAMAAVEYPWSEVVEVAIYTDVVSKFEVEFLAQSNPATVLELIERLEAAEKQRDELNRLCEFNERTMTELLKQRDELLSTVELYEQALKAIWPEGAMGDAFDYWNSARAAIASVKEQK